MANLELRVIRCLVARKLNPDMHPEPLTVRGCWLEPRGQGHTAYFSTMTSLQRGMFRPNVAGIGLMAATSIGVAFAGTLLVLENEGGRKQKEEKGTQT